MAFKLTSFDQSGLELINRQLETLDLHQKQLAVQKQNISILQSKVAALQNQKQSLGTNSVVFTWNGTLSTVSWGPGSLTDRLGNQYPVQKGGSVVLAASSYYWFGWNPTQQTMSYNSNLQTLTTQANIILISQIYTGTAAQAGVVGGGGSDPGGVGPAGKEYKLF